MPSHNQAAATLLAHGGHPIDPLTGAVIPPIHPSTTFQRDPDNAYSRGFVYGRDDTPGAPPVEALLAKLEGGAAAMLMGSGMAAATSVFRALPHGAHVVAPRVMYWGLRNWLQASSGLQVDLVDTSDPDAIRAAVRPGHTALLWLETPANPTWEIADIAAAAGIARAAGARLAVDNTVPTPLLCRPIELGADIVMHSATKYLNGHGDVVAGVLVTAREDASWQRLRAIRHDEGAILAPFEGWLLQRGLRTLHLRVRAASDGAMTLAQALIEHPEVERVLYPGLPSHPGHAIAARQMQGGFGGMLSIEVKGGAPAAIAAAARTEIWVRATSLGGVESLIEHRASIEGQGSPAAPGLLRLSVGIEAPADLLADLDQALRAS